MVAQDASAQGHGVTGVNGTVGPHFQSQLVIIGGVTNAGVLHSIIDLADGGVDGVNRNDTDDSLRSLVPIGGDIAAAMGQGQFHIQRSIGTQSSNMQLGIEDFHLTVSLDVAGSDFALAAGLNVDGLHAFAVQLGDDTLDVQDDLSDIFLHTGNGGKLMLYASDLDRGHRGTGQRGQQDTAQGVTQSRTVATLQGLYDILAVRSITRIFHTFDAGLFDFYHML